MLDRPARSGGDADRDVQPGDIIVRRFRIERRIGAGGMGTVYRGRDLESGRPVAIKRLDIRGKNDADRFAREAAVLADLEHPGVVRYISHGVTEQQEHYLAMEWLEGVTVQERIAEGPLEIANAVRLGIAIAEALAVAHERGIVHRDIKPANLFLPNSEIDRVKVLDFGVARVASSAAMGPTMTRTGAVIGTPGYMAPEQARGEKQLDARADIFALGSVLYEALTGRAPFSGTNVMAVLAKILLEEAPTITEVRRDVPPALGEVIRKMLAKDPEDRPASVAEVERALRTIDIESLVPNADAMVVHYAPTKPPSITDAEQRVICVVLAGQMEATADTWASDESAKMSHELSEVVETLGGRLDPLMDGSSVIHFSGSGIASDLAAQAARCALEVHRAFRDAPVVLATGRGVVSERLPFGEVIDRAARTLTRSQSRHIRLDSASAGLLELAFEVGVDGGGHFLAGERDFVAVGRTLMGKPTKCVGRQRELITLEATFAECTQEPVARAVLITGAPGLGKSRVRAEAVERIKSRADELEILTANADSLAASSPFGLLQQALRRFAGIHDDESIEASRDKLRRRVDRHLPEAERPRITAFLGELANVPFEDHYHERLKAARGDPMLMGDAIRSAWTEWLGAELEHQPLLIVLDNLHWGDLPSVRLIDHALKIHDEAPLMVIGSGRPEVHTAFPNLWRERDVQEIKLGPLTRKASEKLVKTVLSDLDDDQRADLISRADGHPFLLEELMRAFARGERDSLPDSVLGIVQARLDKLGIEAKRVLRAASVFGDRFWRGGVLVLLGGDASTSRVTDWLEELEDREVVEPESDSVFAHERQYTFMSSTVREAAYAMLTDADRELAHRLAGEWLMANGERDAALLAHHFDNSGSPERGVQFYLRAAEHALEGNDLRSVIALVQRGIAAGARGDQLGRLQLLQATAHYWRGESKETIEHAERSATRLPAGSAEWFNAAVLVLSSLGRLGETEALAPWVQRIESIEALPDAVSAQVSCISRTAEHLLILGLPALAEPLLARVDSIEATGAELDALASARLHRGRARRALMEGDPATYAAGLVVAAERFEAAGDIRNACNERMNTGFALSQLGEYDRALSALNRAREDADRAGLNQVVAWADNNLAYVLGTSGRIDEARVVGERAAATGMAQSDPRLEGTSRTYLAATLLTAKDPDGAAREAQRAADLLEQLPSSQLYALGVLSRAQRALGQNVEALETSVQAMALLDSVGAVEEGEALVRIAHAEALHASGRHTDAKEAIEVARDRVFKRAAHITDLTWRTSFIDRVPEHRRTIDLAQAWGLDESPTLSD